LPGVFADNRVTEDGRYVYRYDRYGNLVEKGERIPAGAIRSGDERTHHYSYDRHHRLVSYRCTEGYGSRSITESRYVYDATGRRVCKKVWRRERYATGRCHDYTALPETPEVTWYGWSGDRLVTAQTERSRIQTVYEGGGFTPLVRVETATAALTTARSRRSLAEKLQAEGSEDGAGVVFPAGLVRRLDSLEAELRAGRVSGESRAWLAQCGLTAEQMAGQLEECAEPERKIHLYHCDHRGLPVALINSEGAREWSAEYDVWGNRQREENPQQLEQLLRLPGQQYDDETGLYYNRYRYYNPEQGRYITQDPIGLRGGWNLYQYPLNPVTNTDPLGLEAVFFGPFFLPFPLPKSPAQQEADANAAKALTKWWNDTSFDIMTRDMVVMMIALYVTCSSNGDSAEDSANPNVGKDLTDEEKNELGGASSPNGLGPEDQNGLGGNGAASELPSLDGLDESEAQELLEQRGFKGGKVSDGGWQTFKHADGSQVDINWNTGRTVRTAAPQYGSNGARINKGQRLDSGGREIPRNLPHNEHPTETIDINK
ncbi:RHS repeat-associated core domain-containing protein, partial [Salmonella enterica]